MFSTLFCAFLCRCRCNVKLPSYTFYGEKVVGAHKNFCCLCSRSLFFFFFFTAPHFYLLSARISYFLSSGISFCSSNKIRLLCFLSLASSSFSLFFSLNSAGLSPTFSFSLSFSFSTFQICGLRRHGHRNNFPFRFFLY